jgi:hypothetical protein
MYFAHLAHLIPATKRTSLSEIKGKLNQEKKTQTRTLPQRQQNAKNNDPCKKKTQMRITNEENINSYQLVKSCSR